MMKKLLLLLPVLLLCTKALRAQYDPSFNHYWMMEPQFNPAAVGSTEQLRIMGAYSMQMSGFKRAPRTMYAGADVPFYMLRSYHGAGLTFLNDEIGLFSHKRFSLQYAQHHALWGGRISVGAQVDLVSEAFEGSKVNAADDNDEALPTTDVTGTAVDLGVGLFYRHKDRWYAGLSVLHALSPTVSMNETYQLGIDPTYYFTAGYNIRLHLPFITIRPSVLCKYDGTDFRADLTGRVEYRHDKKCLYAGAAYSPSHSVTAFVGGLFHGVNLSYSYEAYTSMPTITTGATHEIVIVYGMDLNLYKKGRNLHKSVRWL